MSPTLAHEVHPTAQQKTTRVHHKYVHKTVC
jgi:hypothetical protein